MEPAITTAPPAPAQPTEIPPAGPRRSGSDTLTVFWYPGHFHLAVVRRQNVAGVWSSPTEVQTATELAGTLQDGLTALSFTGTETTLVLEHPLFKHQIESAPPLAPHAVQTLLRARAERNRTDGDGVLWVSQALASAKTESSHLLHSLPSSFYRDINAVMLHHQLDLTRILPLSLVLSELGPVPTPANGPSLIVAELGGNVCIQAMDTKNCLILSRVLQADWEKEAERIGVETNRCALFVKQRFSTPVSAVRLLGRNVESTTAELTKRCPADASVTAAGTGLGDWFQAVLRIPLHHPANLLAQYLARKRSLRLWRQGVIAAAWLGVVVTALSVWTLAQEAQDAASRYAQLQRDHGNLLAERERLLVRNQELEYHEGTIRAILHDRSPAVPPRVLSVLASTAPSNATLYDCILRFDPTTDRWTLRLTGQIVGDEFTAQETLTSWFSQLEKTALRIKVPVATRNLAPAVQMENPNIFRFAAEGGLLEP